MRILKEEMLDKIRWGKMISQFISWGTKNQLNKQSMSYLKTLLFPKDILSREKVIRGGNSKTIETYNRVAKEEKSLVAHISTSAKDMPSQMVYDVVVMKGKKKYFIFVSYNEKSFLKAFGSENSVAIWETNKSNFDWIERHPQLTIDNPSEWEKLKGYVTALGLSTGEI